VNYAAGSSIAVGGERYELRQLHFHHPSEERINGKAYDMVVHLVHANAKGELAVVAVLLRRGAENETIAKIWAALPTATAAEAEGRELAEYNRDIISEVKVIYAPLGRCAAAPFAKLFGAARLEHGSCSVVNNG
jgi:carbonic anhydrase